MKKLFLIAAIFISVFAEAQMTQIQITGLRRNNSYGEGSYKMRFTLPTIYGTGANPISGLNEIVASYPGFSTEIIPVIGTVIVYNGVKSFDLSATTNQIQTFLQNEYENIRSQLDVRVLSPIDNAIGQKWNGVNWTSSSTIVDNPFPEEFSSGVTSIGTAGAAVTLTIPAIIGKFHNITHISITAYSSAARTGNATPINVTSTNLPGNMAWTFATAAAIGTVDRQPPTEASSAIRSMVANTATTIVCPAITGVIWRVNIFYTTTN